MKATATRRAGKSARTAFPLNPFAAGCAVLLSALAGQAFAQASGSEEQTAVAPNTPTAAATSEVVATPAAAPAPSVSTVTVTGIRQGIEAAISVKRNSIPSSKRFRPKTSASCPIPRWPNRSRACRA